MEIGETIFTDINDKYLTLENEEYVRTMAIGNTWQSLRVGIMCSITPDGTANIVGTNGAVGVSAGKAQPFGAALSTHVVGAPFAGLFASTYTFTYNAGNEPYFAGPGNAQGFKRVGSTITNASNSIGLPRIASASGLERRSIVFVDILKGSPWNIGGWGCTIAQAEQDQSLARFKSAIAQEGTPTLGGANMIGGAASNKTLVVDENTDGFLDTVAVLWKKAANPMRIFAVAAHRFS